MAKSTPEAASLAPEVLAKYEPVIGLEVHVQLLTRTKIFCGCSTRFGDPPNTNVCPVCLGLPGTLPVLNKRAVEMAMRAALALNCTVHDHSRFARKNYFYPDLPKGYQISQYELPLATGGWLEIEVGGEKKRIGITRLHLEEDAAKNLHEGFSQSATKAYIDYNRCGTPLSEIVSQPDMRTPEEAYAYLTTLRQIMLYTGVSDCNMEEGSLRCDANVSVRPRGSKEFGTNAEVLTSTQSLADYFEAVVKAGAPGKAAANWMQTELLRGLKDSGKEITASPVSPVALGELVKLVESGKITGAVAKKVFATMFESGRSAAEIVAAEGLGAQVSDVAIEQAAREVIAKNPANVAKFKSGNEGVFKFFVGQVMKATRGQANPQAVNDILRKLLA